MCCVYECTTSCSGPAIYMHIFYVHICNDVLYVLLALASTVTVFGVGRPFMSSTFYCSRNSSHLVNLAT